MPIFRDAKTAVCFGASSSSFNSMLLTFTVSFFFGSTILRSVSPQSDSSSITTSVPPSSLLRSVIWESDSRARASESMYYGGYVEASLAFSYAFKGPISPYLYWAFTRDSSLSFSALVRSWNHFFWSYASTIAAYLKSFQVMPAISVSSDNIYSAGST